MNDTTYRPVQQFALITLRTVIGWHFLYEAYYKIWSPAWGPAGTPLVRWTSAGYLKGASGPLAGLFQRMVNGGWTPWMDRTVKICLLLIGLSLILGLFTRIGAWGALCFLSLFYLLYVPLTGVPQPGSEGTYLIVNKTLIEAVAVGILIAFDTGAIAGLDLLLRGRKLRHLQLEEASLSAPASVVSQVNRDRVHS
ncbi:MAG: DoxX family membrane protein [Pyrinomonadaceae bacterium]|nr:DoxX family membrane protein [Pyrinomonadaceae bacterium]